jgi:membrane associated rhomboid family serine protease
MRRLQNNGLFATPHAVVVLLAAANVIVFLVCFRTGGNVSIPTDVLVANGALTSTSLAARDYWRLIAYGFLHANPLHLTMNMISLAVCGPPLERRLGASAFIIVYAASLIGAALVSTFAHAGPFVSVGASGAIFGLLGALFALWILGATELSPSFFLVNFALNFAFATRAPNIDWGAHIGGFVTGMVMCALLD